MGVMTLSGFRDDLLFHLENRNDSGLTTERLNRWINQAYIHVCRPEVRKQREMQFVHDVTLASGANEYNLSTTRPLVGVRNVTYYYDAPANVGPTTRRAKVKPRSIQYMDDQTKYSGIPTRYALEGTLLVLNATPGLAQVGDLVRVRYWGEPLRLSSDGQATVLEEYWDEVILMGARFRAEWALSYRENAIATGQLYQSLINESADDMELNAEDDDFRMEIKHESYMPLGG